METGSALNPSAKKISGKELASGESATKRKTREGQKETTVIGIVREINDKAKSFEVGIAVGDEIYRVQPNEEGQNLLYEVGIKVEAIGVISRTKDGRRRLEVTGYEVFEMSEDDPEEFDYDLAIRSNTNPAQGGCRLSW